MLSEEKVVSEARIEVEGCSRLESISNRPVEVFNQRAGSLESISSLIPPLLLQAEISRKVAYRADSISANRHSWNRTL